MNELEKEVDYVIKTTRITLMVPIILIVGLYTIGVGLLICYFNNIIEPTLPIFFCFFTATGLLAIYRFNACVFDDRLPLKHTVIITEKITKDHEYFCSQHFKRWNWMRINTTIWGATVFTFRHEKDAILFKMAYS